MADYWKSQARKFCEFCKCWIADNKPSIQFHETGKRHKENVAQKLALLTKKSVKEQKQSLKVNEEMKKMEEAAMKAYLKDIESNPDYTSQVLISKIEEKKKEIELQQKKEKGDEIVEKKEDSSSSIEQSEVGTSGEEQKVWYEAQSDEGYTYYWNYSTGESIWEPPEEGYVSLAEQNSSSTSEKVKSKEVAEDVKEKVDSNTTPKADDVSKDHKKKRKKVEEIEEDPSVPQIGPSMKPDPYGGWTTVENRVEEPVDLQLPYQEYVEIKVPTLETEQPLIKFKEKTITSLGTGDANSGGPSFKKRKFGAKSRGNMRQKFDDDDD